MSSLKLIIYLLVATVLSGAVTAFCTFEVSEVDCTSAGRNAVLRWASNEDNAHPAIMSYTNFEGVVCCDDITTSGSTPLIHLSSNEGNAHASINDWGTNGETILTNINSVTTIDRNTQTCDDVCVFEMSNDENAHIAQCESNVFDRILCAEVGENCANNIDDNGDGLIDCADPDCYTGEAIPEAEITRYACTNNEQEEESWCVDYPENCHDTENDEYRYCSDGNNGEMTYIKQPPGPGACAPRNTYPSRCSCDENAATEECGASFTDENPQTCQDWSNTGCPPGEDLFYEATSRTPKTNPESICCPTGQYAYYDENTREYRCRSTEQCYDPGPVDENCLFDFEDIDVGEHINPEWATSTTNDPTNPAEIWCTAPAPLSGNAAQACCPVVKFGQSDYYFASEENVKVY